MDLQPMPWPHTDLVRGETRKRKCSCICRRHSISRPGLTPWWNPHGDERTSKWHIIHDKCSKDKNNEDPTTEEQTKKNKTSLRLYETVEEFKYLKTTINSRGVITPALKALKKRTNICIHAIHKLTPNMVDMTTGLDIFSIYSHILLAILLHWPSRLWQQWQHSAHN